MRLSAAGVQTTAELIAYARQNPGKLRYGATSFQGVFATEQFNALAGTRIERVPHANLLARYGLQRGFDRLSPNGEQTVPGQTTKLQPAPSSSSCCSRYSRWYNPSSIAINSAWVPRSAIRP